MDITSVPLSSTSLTQMFQPFKLRVVAAPSDLHPHGARLLWCHDVLSQKLRLSADEIQVERPWMMDPMIVNREVLSAALSESQSGQIEIPVSITSYLEQCVIRNSCILLDSSFETPLFHDD